VSITPPRRLPTQAIEIRGASAQRQVLPTYYPGVANPADATLIRITSSIEALQLRALQGPLLTVQVTVPSLASQRDSSVMLKSRRHDEDGSTLWGLNAGKVAIPSVPPGEYVVVAAKTAIGRTETHGSLPVTVTDANVEVTVPPAEPVALKGRIRIEGVADFESFVAAAFNARQEAPRPLAMTLLSTPEYFAASVSIPVAKDGSFDVSAVQPIRYSLNLPLPRSSTYVKRVALNDRLMSVDTIDLSQGGDSTLEIVLSPRTATLDLVAPKGWPTASNPAQRTFTVWSTRPMAYPLASYSVGYTLPRTSIDALPPGDYYAVAWEEVPPFEILGEPAFLARFIPLAARVTLEEGGRASVEANLIPREELRRVITEVPAR
jgi:hypothetical protein